MSMMMMMMLMIRILISTEEALLKGELRVSLRMIRLSLSLSLI